MLNLSKPDGRQPSPLSTSELAPLPSSQALFGDVSKQLEEHGKHKEALQQRNDAQLEKLNLGLQVNFINFRNFKILQDKIRARQAAGGGGPPSAGKPKKKSLSGNKAKSNKRRSRKERRQSIHPGAD